MIETYACAYCAHRLSPSEARILVDEIAYDSIKDEINGISHLVCPECGNIVMACWEVLSEA